MFDYQRAGNRIPCLAVAASIIFKNTGGVKLKIMVLSSIHPLEGMEWLKMTNSVRFF